MSDMKISPLGGIYLEEAVRRLAVATPLELPWNGNVAQALKMWIERVKRDLVADRTGFLSFPRAWMGSYPEIATRRMLFGRAQIDPFRMDVFDVLVILASNDEDFTQDKNLRGPSKKWSAETRRLLSQIHSCNRVNKEDILTMRLIAIDHLEQIADHVASMRGADPKGVFAILRQRAKQSGFILSQRLRGILDNTFDFRTMNYIWSTSDTIRVHAPGRERQKPFEDFYRQLKNSGKFPDFYTWKRGLVDQYSHRVINGNREPYQALRFPADPIVAQSLMAIGADQKDALGVLTVVDVTTTHLSKRIAGQPMLLGHTDPGLISADHTDGHEHPEFSR